MLAAYSMKDEKEKALLNYSEAYCMQQYDEDETHKGICLANIGGIMTQTEEYEMAAASFEVSCEYQQAKLEDSKGVRANELKLEKDREEAEAADRFILACRKF